MRQILFRFDAFRWVRQWISLSLLLIVFLFQGTMSIAFAEGEAILSPSPIGIGLKPGEEGSVAIQINNVENLYGLELHLSFDPNILEVVDSDSVKDDVQIEVGELFIDGFAAVNKVDNTTGTIDFAVTLLNPAPPISGQGTIARITFRAKAEGETALAKKSVILASREAQEIPATWQPGSIKVSASGEAPEVQQLVEIQSQSENQAISPSAENSATSWQLYVGAGAGILVFVIAFIVLITAIKKKQSH